MIAFVILHYLAFEDTCECVSSIMERVGTNDYKIIVVDNNSLDDSYKKLKDKYINSDKIILIHNNDNLGFAKGNNVGFKYAKENLNPNYIVLCNNDVCLIQDSFYNQVDKFYKETNFDVMGPKIKTKDGLLTSNPEDEGHVFTEKQINHLIFRFTKSYILNALFIKESKKKSVKKIINEVKKDVILHGSFLVFSKNYISKFDGLDPRTHMYLEEDILYLHLVKNNMSSYYNPNITIYHKEDASTNKAMNSNRKKKMFIAKNTICSLKVYKRILNEYKWY